MSPNSLVYETIHFTQFKIIIIDIQLRGVSFEQKTLA